MCGEGSSGLVLHIEILHIEIPLVNQKLTFDKRISCITRHDDFFTERSRAVSLQVAPFLRDCNGRGYGRDRRAGQTERK